MKFTVFRLTFGVMGWMVWLTMVVCCAPCLAQGGTITAWGTKRISPGEYNEFVAVATNNSHNIAPNPDGTVVGLKADGSVVCWGQNNHGQCNVPDPNADFIAIAAGHGHTVGLKQDGTVIGWGDNAYLQCAVPEPNKDFVAIAAGANHTIGLKRDGSVICWGFDNFGQCTVPEPKQGFVAISAGNCYSVGLKNDGSVVCWGLNNFGQLNVPEPNEDFSAVAAGDAHVVGLKVDGSVTCWGHGGNYQLVVPEPNSGFNAVAAGDGHSVGMKSNGKLVCWGLSNYSQCVVPTPNAGFTSISAGGYATTAIRGVSSFAGLIRLDNFAGDLVSQVLKIAFCNSVEPSAVHAFTLSPQPDGNFSLSTYMPPPYDIRVGSPHFLTAKAANVAMGEILNFTLVNGDADGDGQINLFDFVVLDMNFGKSTPMADLNGDGQVNLFDYVVIDQNFGAKGIEVSVHARGQKACVCADEWGCVELERPRRSTQTNKLVMTRDR